MDTSDTCYLEKIQKWKGNLDKLLTDANRKIEKEAVIIPGKNLFIRPSTKYVQNAIQDADEVIVFSDTSDKTLSKKINNWLSQDEYDNIFIPLCFGPTLSDYNGLEIATHVRCTCTPNQLNRIFIYSIVGIEYLLHNEYFNILKTKNVELVDYSKYALKKAASLNFSPLKSLELPREIKS